VCSVQTPNLMNKTFLNFPYISQVLKTQQVLESHNKVRSCGQADRNLHACITAEELKAI